MPQTNVIPDWKATYVHDAPVQKPGGVTVSTALIATAVPNKPTYVAGTIQMASVEGEVQESVPEEVTAQAEPEEEPDPESSSTTTVTRTTTRTRRR
jgi:hypothetical protein